MSGTIELDSRVKIISTGELKKKIASKEDFLLVDVNPRDRFDKHHIKGAVFVDYEKAASWFIKNNIPKDKTIALYCENTMCTSSPLVSNKLSKLGYTNVNEYSLGIQGWIKEGGEWEGNDKK